MTLQLCLLIVVVLVYIGFASVVKMELFESFDAYKLGKFCRILLRLAALLWPITLPIIIAVIGIVALLE